MNHAPTGVNGAEPGIRVDDLVVRHGPRAVVDGLSMRVDRGELVALLGPNGAGKTTTVETITGFRRPDHGRVSVLGVAPTAGGPGLRARLGVMLQEGGLEPRATPRDLVRLEAALKGRPADEADAALRLVGLTERATDRIRRLSGGERQRTALALALIGEPDVIVLDEPTAGLDPAARRVVREHIAGLRDAGRAILLTTHDLADVERLADRVVIVVAGRVIAEGPPDRVGRDAVRPGAPGSTGVPTGPTGLVFDRALTAEESADLERWAADRGVRIVPGVTGPGPGLPGSGAAGDLEARYLALTGDRDVEHVA